MAFHDEDFSGCITRRHWVNESVIILICEVSILAHSLQGLSDTEEFVVCKALNALTCLAELGLLQKPTLQELVSEIVPFLCHPVSICYMHCSLILHNNVRLALLETTDTAVLLWYPYYVGWLYSRTNLRTWDQKSVLKNSLWSRAWFYNQKCCLKIYKDGDILDTQTFCRQASGRKHWKHCFICSVRSTVHINPSRDGSFSKTLFKLAEFDASFSFLCGRKFFGNWWP